MLHKYFNLIKVRGLSIFKRHPRSLKFPRKQATLSVFSTYLQCVMKYMLHNPIAMNVCTCTCICPWGVALNTIYKRHVAGETQLKKFLIYFEYRKTTSPATAIPQPPYSIRIPWLGLLAHHLFITHTPCVAHVHTV